MKQSWSRNASISFNTYIGHLVSRVALASREGCNCMVPFRSGSALYKIFRAAQGCARQKWQRRSLWVRSTHRSLGPSKERDASECADSASFSLQPHPQAQLLVHPTRQGEAWARGVPPPIERLQRRVRMKDTLPDAPTPTWTEWMRMIEKKSGLIHLGVTF